MKVSGICLFVSVLLFLTFAQPNLPRPQLSPPPALPRSQERKVWRKVPNKGSGESSAPASAAAAAPGRPRCGSQPRAAGPAPACPRGRRYRWEREKSIIWICKPGAARRALGRAPAPRPASPGSALPEATSGHKQPSPNPPLPHLTRLPWEGRELGNERLTPQSRPPEAGIGSYSVKAIVLFLYIHIYTYI